MKFMTVRIIESFILYKTKRTDIQDQWGPAPMPRTTDSPFDICQYGQSGLRLFI
ncbi:hypothetical protein [Peribacillus sp. SCS-37]|uniref:hypothetical protein n=1 Tax=Paraperibacillus esterisolvens TaxID=3115296 RepID=UPI00390608D7